MFSDLFWALYLIDVLSQIGPAIFWSVCLLALAVALPNVFYAVDSGKVIPSKWFNIGLPVIILSVALLMALIPSKQTMYMMVGVRATTNFTQTEMGKKLEAYINGQMDEFLNKKK